jgi:hypothetical protein
VLLAFRELPIDIGQKVRNCLGVHASPSLIGRAARQPAPHLIASLLG